MEHIAAIMLIIGCPADLGACEELPAPFFAYETVQDCRVDLPAARRGFDGTHERVFSGCFAVDPMLMETDAEIVWSVESGTLQASVEPAGSPSVAVAHAHDAARISQE